MTAYIQNDGPILVVDDDPDFQTLIRIVFTKSEVDHPLVVLSSGYECLEYLAAVTQQQKPTPSLILLDINMPKLDGIDTLRQIRSHETFKTIPAIAMLTSSDDVQDIRRALEAGADDYKVKPFAIGEFIDLIHSLVKS